MDTALYNMPERRITHFLKFAPDTNQDGWMGCGLVDNQVESSTNGRVDMSESATLWCRVLCLNVKPPQNQDMYSISLIFGKRITCNRIRGNQI